METSQPGFVLGQRYAFATIALVVAFLSFINLAGMEKGVLAILLAYRALTTQPAPSLGERRGWAKTAIFVAVAHIILIVTVILLNLDRLAKLIDALRGLSDLR